VNDDAARRALPEESPDLAGVLGRAFADDPIACWLEPDRERRIAKTLAVFQVMSEEVLSRRRSTYTTPSRQAVAVWAPPGTWQLTQDEAARLRPRLAEIHTPEANARLADALGVIDDELHPAFDHWYLEFLGTDPLAQGRGLATKAIGPVLTRCDAEGIPAYLWTATPANVAFYEHRGFEVRWTWKIPAGPDTWGMWRPPRH
jgi:GNAT superfamily N-acetyltransferase